MDKGQDAFALDGGGVLKTIAVDTSKDALLQAHVVKLINFQVPVRFENLFRYLICTNGLSLTQTYSDQYLPDFWSPQQESVVF